MFFFPSPRFHAHRGHGGRPEASGRPTRGPAGLREQPTPGGPAAGGQAAHDPAPPEADGHQGSAALLQHQGAGKGSHAQTVPGDAGGQGVIRTGLVWTGQRPQPRATTGKKRLETRLKVLKKKER